MAVFSAQASCSYYRQNGVARGGARGSGSYKLHKVGYFDIWVDGRRTRKRFIFKRTDNRPMVGNYLTGRGLGSVRTGLGPNANVHKVRMLYFIAYGIASGEWRTKNCGASGSGFFP